MLKRILCVKASTPTYMIYGETGCTPPSINIRERAMNFWLKTSQQGNLATKAQQILLKIHDHNGYSSPYINYIKESFNTSGLTYLFEDKNSTHTNNNYSKHLINQRIKDQFSQTWKREMNESTKSTFYRTIKESRFLCVLFKIV